MRWARGLVTLLLAAVAAGAAVLIGASFLVEPGVGTRIPGAAPTPEHLRAAAERARWIGALLAVASLALTPLRDRIAAVLAREIGSAGDRLAERESALLNGLRSDGGLHLGALAAVVAAGVALRLLHLSQPIRYDEAATYLSFATRPLYLLVSDYSYPNNHILHTLLVRGSTELFGGSPAAIRIPAFLSGVLVVPVTYLFTRDFYGRWAALLAAGLVAASAPQILYSTNARGYTLVGLCFLALLPVARRAVGGRPDGWWLPFVALTAAGFWTIPVMAFPFLLVLCWMALEIRFEKDVRDRPLRVRRTAAATGIAAAVTLLLYVPPLVVSGPRRVFAPPVLGSPLPPGEFLAALPAHLSSVWAQWTLGLPWWVGAVLVAGFGVSLLRHREVADHECPVPAAALALLPVLLLRRIYPAERAWLFLLPLFLAAAAAGLVHLVRRIGADRPRVRRAVVAAVAVIFPAAAGAGILRSEAVVRSTETGTFRAAERVARFLDAELRTGDRVLAMVPSTAPLRYHLEARGRSERVLDEGPAPEGRYLVVVDRREGQTLPEVLERRGLPADAARWARSLERFDGSTVYGLPRSRVGARAAGGDGAAG